MLQNANIDQRIPRFVSTLDSCLYKIVTTDDLLQKGEIINRFLNENMEYLNDLQNNFFTEFAYSFIHQIRQKIDKYIKKLESITDKNLHANPELIAAQQLLIDFFTPEMSSNKFQANNSESNDANNRQDKSNNKIGIPEPVDFVSIYKDAFTKLKIEKIAPKSDYKFMNDYYLTYKAIFSIVRQIPQIQSFKNDFQPILSAEKLPLKYTFKMVTPSNTNGNSEDSENPSDKEKEITFTVHSTVRDAKIQLAKELGVPYNSITLKYDFKPKSTEDNSQSSTTTAATTTVATPDVSNTSENSSSNNNNNRNFFYNSHKNNNKNNIYYDPANNNANNYGDIQEITAPNNNSSITGNNSASSGVLINEMFLVHYKSYIPFIVEFVPPPPIKYRFMTPKRNVSKPYDYSKTVADVKSDLRAFLQHEVQLKFKGKLLDDQQKLSLLNIGNEIIEVTFTPDYKFKLTTGEIIVESFQSNTIMFNIYSTLRQKLDFNFFLFFRKKLALSSSSLSPQPSSARSNPSSPDSNLQPKPQKISSTEPNFQISPPPNLPAPNIKPGSPIIIGKNSRSEAKFDLSPNPNAISSSNSNNLINLTESSKSDCQFNLNLSSNREFQSASTSPRSESNYELAYEYSEPIGNRNEIRVFEIKKIIHFFTFPSNSIRQILFDENDTVETAKDVIKKIIIDRSMNVPNLDYLSIVGDRANFKILSNFNYNMINLNKLTLGEGDDFILTINKKPLSRLTMPLSSIPNCSLISIQPTDSLLIQLVVSNGERYEIQMPKTATVKDAKIEASNLFNCDFVFMKKEKVMKESKLLILISNPQIKVEMPNQIYQFLFPNGKNKKHEFSPTLTIHEIKKFVANHQKCDVESIQLTVKGKELKDKSYLYDIDYNSLICVNVFITLPFFISSKNKQSKKSLSFDINSTFKNVRLYLSEKTKHAVDKLSFFDENELFIEDEKKLIDMINTKIITVIIHQKSPEFNESDFKQIDELVSTINSQLADQDELKGNEDNGTDSPKVNVNRDTLLALYIKCGLDMDRLQKNLSFFMKNKLMDRLNDVV